MKADGSQLIPRKHTEILVLLSVLQFSLYFWGYLLAAIRMNIIFIPIVLLQQIFEIWIFQPL